MRARLAFLVTGGTGAGKTTMLAALLGRVDPGERIVASRTPPNSPRPPARRASGRASGQRRGVGAVTVRDLVRQSLRMRPDRIVVGEVRGAEVVDLLTALLNTVTTAVRAPCTPTRPASSRRGSRRSPHSVGSTGCTAQPIGAAVQVVLHVERDTSGAGPSRRSRCCAATPQGRWRWYRPGHSVGGVHAAGKVLQDMLLRRGES
ncbi:hypothetical protein GS508_25045 [Rhodococcus hoagii]|nr:hypothetical protein [Prescottella equi]